MRAKGEREMAFLDNILLSLESLKANKLRAILTMLGIIIGIGSVITINTVGVSLTSTVSSSMQSLGATTITVQLTQKNEDDENTKKIFMYIFKNGYRKLISFNNTYPIKVDEEKNLYTLPFAKPLNDSFALICLEKGYAAFKSDKKTIKSGFKKIEGGFSFNTFNDLLGTNSEIIFKKKNSQKKYLEKNLGLNTFDLEKKIKISQEKTLKKVF